MNKFQRKAASAAMHKDIAKRFPKGGTDTLGGNTMLGNNYRSVDSQVFGSQGKRKACKLFAAN